MLECDAMVQISSLLCIRAELRETFRVFERSSGIRSGNYLVLEERLNAFETNEEIRKFELEKRIRYFKEKR